MRRSSTWRRQHRSWPVRHDIWDVHGVVTRWWIVTNPTNHYDQSDFKSRDVVLTFHIGQTLRIEYGQKCTVLVAPASAGSQSRTVPSARRSPAVHLRRPSGPGSSREPGTVNAQRSADRLSGSRVPQTNRPRVGTRCENPVTEPGGEHGERTHALVLFDRQLGPHVQAAVVVAPWPGGRRASQAQW
jgi:hypothetical protein